MEGGFGGGQPCGLAAALAQGRRPPKAGGGPTKYHQPAFRNSLHRSDTRGTFWAPPALWGGGAGGQLPPKKSVL